jgi:hypothetical protein
MTHDYKLPPVKAFTMGIHNAIRGFSLNDVKSLGLDTSTVIEEKVPIVIEQAVKKRITRISYDQIRGRHEVFYKANN